VRLMGDRGRFDEARVERKAPHQRKLAGIFQALERRARALTAPGSDVTTPRTVADLLLTISIAKLVRPLQRPPAPAHRRFIARLFDRLLA